MARSTYQITALEAVLHAAQAVLTAREDQMLTSAEWEALEHAVAVCMQPPAPRPSVEVFVIEDGDLVRRVTPRRGRPYEHRCERDAFEAICHAIDEAGAPGGFTLEKLRHATGQPWTRIAVALAFLKERGCVTPAHGRHHVPASEDVYLDAMIEWHALAGGESGEPTPTA